MVSDGARGLSDGDGIAGAKSQVLAMCNTVSRARGRQAVSKPVGLCDGGGAEIFPWAVVLLSRSRLVHRRLAV